MLTCRSVFLPRRYTRTHTHAPHPTPPPQKTNGTVNTKNRKRKGGAKSNADDIIRSVEQWIVAEIDRERFNEKVFSSRNLAKTVSLICGALKSTVLRGRKRNALIS